MNKAIESVKTYLQELQNQLCSCIEQHEASVRFQHDLWQHEIGSGGGESRVLQGGQLFEQAGVNFSHIQAQQLPRAATLKRPELEGQSFEAVGISSVIHPLNPYLPTTHLNLRMFVTENKQGETLWWMGGGFDLTPYYGFEEDARLWHQEAYDACKGFGQDVYPRYKKACDEYFYLKHRNETRGIGGLFFDDLNEWGFERCFAFMHSVGNHFIQAYQKIIERRKNHTYGQREREFQLYRRGRYVEFNLLYDRGTLFGLQSGGRTESILMSLPPEVHWRYNWVPEAGTEEARLYTDFLVPREWVESM